MKRCGLITDNVKQGITLGAFATVLLSLNMIVDIFRELGIFLITVHMFTRPTIVTSSLQGLPAVNVDSKDISSRSKCKKWQNQKFTNIIHNKYLQSLLNLKFVLSFLF